MVFPAMLAAQGPRQGPAWWESAWWNSPLVQNLDLSEAVQRADGDLEIALGESSLDQRKANEAIEHLASARGELTRTLSQMTLRLRTILTNEQWQELQNRQAERRAGPLGGRRGPGGRFGSGPAATQQR